MHIRLIAVGDRQPSWVDSAFENYLQRLPQQWQFRLDLVATARRSKNCSAETAKIAEGNKVLAKIKASDYVVVLDERGKEFSSQELAIRRGNRLANRMVAFIFMVFAITISFHTIATTDFLLRYPHFSKIEPPLAFLLGPFFYFYVRALTDGSFRLGRKHLLHFIPALLCIIALLPGGVGSSRAGPTSS